MTGKYMRVPGTSLRVLRDRSQAGIWTVEDGTFAVYNFEARRRSDLRKGRPRLGSRQVDMWKLMVMDGSPHDAGRRLVEMGLHGREFRTRRDALRALEAALVTEPDPT